MFLKLPWTILLGFVLTSFITTPLIGGVAVLNGLSHIYQSNSGELVKGWIEIQNSEATDQAVKIYQRDYLFNHTGETLYNDPNSHARSNASWIDLSTQYLILKPKEKTIIPFEIQIPWRDSLIGTYWSVIMVEGIDVVDSSKISKGIHVRTALRYAIQIINTIRSGKPQLDFVDVALAKESGERFLKVDISNSGQRYLRPELILELFDATGNSIGVFKSKKRKTFPGTSVRMHIPLNEVKSGAYKAVLLADCGEEDVFGLNLTLEMTDE